MTLQARNQSDRRFVVSDDTGPIVLLEDHVGDIRGDTLIVNAGTQAMSAVKVRELYVHGTLRGVVDAEIVTVAKSGRIIGNVNCKHLRVKGVVEGGMIASSVMLRDGGRLEGDIVADELRRSQDSTIVGQASIGPGMVERRKSFGSVVSRTDQKLVEKPRPSADRLTELAAALVPLAAVTAPTAPGASIRGDAPDARPPQSSRVKPYLLVQ